MMKNPGFCYCPLPREGTERCRLVGQSRFNPQCGKYL